MSQLEILSISYKSSLMRSLCLMCRQKLQTPAAESFHHMWKVFVTDNYCCYITQYNTLSMSKPKVIQHVANSRISNGMRKWMDVNNTTISRHHGWVAEWLSATNGAAVVCRDPANDHPCELHILSQNLQPICLKFISVSVSLTHTLTNTLTCTYIFIQSLSPSNSCPKHETLIVFIKTISIHIFSGEACFLSLLSFSY